MNKAGLLRRYAPRNDMEKLASEVSDLLKVNKMKLRVAESFTGGLICSLLVQNAGASEYLLEGLVCYSDEAKADRLGVDRGVIDEYGAVSCAVCDAMLESFRHCERSEAIQNIELVSNAGLLRYARNDIIIATTGNADPSSCPRIGFIGVKTKEIAIIKKISLNKSRVENIKTGAAIALQITLEILKENT